MNNNQYVKTISKEKFNVFLNRYFEIPSIYGEEIAWFSDTNNRILASVYFDAIDFNFSAIIFEQNENMCFNASSSKIDFATSEDAVQWIQKKVKTLQESRFQKNTPKSKLALFEDIVDPQKQNSIYKLLKNEREWNSAKNLINAVLPYYTDIDGNFVQQFQSDGFDQRLWELYLFNYFNEELLEIDRSKSSPDFVLLKDNQMVGVEAVTISKRNEKIEQSNFENKILNEDYLKNEMPLLWSSALFNKLEHKSINKGCLEKKHYWEKEGLEGKPFVIAVQDFHKEFSMTWSNNSLCELLYGIRYTANVEEDNLNIQPHKIDPYKKSNGTEIPSGFFFSQPNAKYLSAVIANPLGTLPKFNRIGKERGFDEFDTTMLFQGLCYNHKKNAIKPNSFEYFVTEGRKEEWGHGVVIYHNPNCLFPLDEDFFPRACHCHFKNGLIESKTPPFHPFSSITTFIRKEK